MQVNRIKIQVGSMKIGQSHGDYGLVVGSFGREWKEKGVAYCYAYLVKNQDLQLVEAQEQLLFEYRSHY